MPLGHSDFVPVAGAVKVMMGRAYTPLMLRIEASAVVPEGGGSPPSGRGEVILIQKAMAVLPAHHECRRIASIRAGRARLSRSAEAALEDPEVFLVDISIAVQIRWNLPLEIGREIAACRQRGRNVHYGRAR
jgi:hypothetical protein